MATLANTLSYARAKTQSDSNGLTDANGIIFANEALLDFHTKLIENGIDASQVQEAYKDGAVNTGTYLYPTDMFFLKTIELNYTNTNEQDYKTASQLDAANIPGNASFSWLRKNASKDLPYFDDRGDWYEIFPTPTSSDNVSSLIRIIYFLKPTEFTATSDTISYPASLDYRILGDRIAADYFWSLEKNDMGDKYNEQYLGKVRSIIDTLSRGSQQPIQATPIQLSGFEF